MMATAQRYVGGKKEREADYTKELLVLRVMIIKFACEDNE